MTNLNGSREPGTPHGTVACWQCGATVATSDTTCTRCGVDLLAAASVVATHGSRNGSSRRRIGGTSWVPEAAAADASPPESTTANSTSINSVHAARSDRPARRRLGTANWKSVANGTAAPAIDTGVDHRRPAPGQPNGEPVPGRHGSPPSSANGHARNRAPSPTIASHSNRQRKKRRRSAYAPGKAAIAGAAQVATAPAARIAAQSARTAHAPTRRRHRRHWYRRPLLVVPVALLGLMALALGVITYRAESTINTIHQVSTPPQVVADATLDDDPIWDTLQINTGPAREAVRAIAAAEGEDEPDGDDGGGFGRVVDAASNVGDLANGAAVASGVKDGNDNSRTILVMGVDAQPGSPIDIAVRPDALMVLRLDQDDQSCHLLAIPRDTRTRLPGYGETKINHALMVGGIPYQQLVVEQLLSIEIDSYLLVDFVGFEKLVDSVGGIAINVPEVLDDRGYHFDPGLQTFDGAQALAYVRYRADDQGDVGRIHRQWAVLEALLNEGSTRDLVSDVNTILPALEDHLRSDLDASAFAAIAKTYGGRCTVATIDTVLLDGLRVRLDDPMLQQSVYYNVVTEDQVQEAVDAFLGRESTAAGTDLSGTGHTPPSGPSVGDRRSQAVYAHRQKWYRKVSL